MKAEEIALRKSDYHQQHDIEYRFKSEVRRAVPAPPAPPARGGGSSW